MQEEWENVCNIEWNDSMKEEERDQWEIYRHEIRIHESCLLGSGSFGSVYMGTWRGVSVAVKILDPPPFFFAMEENEADPGKKENEKKKEERIPPANHPHDKCSQHRQLIHEFELLVHLHHPHIIQLLGYLREPFAIVMEYASEGSITSFLERHPSLSLSQRIEMGLQIAQGLVYLHERHPHGIIHRDIKPSNLLVTHGGQVKIADFGLSKWIETKRRHISGILPSFYQTGEMIIPSAMAGSISYMAPEMYSLQTYSHKIDIYSFGVILYELISLRRYVELWETETAFVQSLQRHVVDMEEENKTSSVVVPPLPFDRHCPRSVQVLIQQCLAHRPSERPHARTIVEVLSRLLQQKQTFFLCGSSWNDLISCCRLG